jgi:hypothetical protein
MACISPPSDGANMATLPTVTTAAPAMTTAPAAEPRRVPRHDPTQLYRGFHGVGAAGHGELAVAEGFLAHGADGHWVKVGAAGVLEDDRLGAGVDVSVTPFFERDEDRLKISPGVSQQVLVARRTLRIPPARDHTCLFEFAQPCCEHVARRPRARGDVLKACVSVADLAGHQQRIAVADDRERIRDRAHSWGRFAFWTHCK